MKYLACCCASVCFLRGIQVFAFKHVSPKLARIYDKRKSKQKRIRDVSEAKKLRNLDSTTKVNTNQHLLCVMMLKNDDFWTPSRFPKNL